MFIGHGFDTDGDGDNDFFIAGRVGGLTPQGCAQFLAAMAGLIVFAGLVAIAEVCSFYRMELAHIAFSGYWFFVAVFPFVLVLHTAIIATLVGCRVWQSPRSDWQRPVASCAAIAVVIAVILGNSAFKRMKAVLSRAREEASMLTVTGARVASGGGAPRLESITTMSPEAAAVLASRKGNLVLNGLTALSPEVAEALARHEEWHYLSLNGVTSLSGEAAENLSRHPGAISLRGLTTLSDEAAEAISKHGTELSLRLTTLSDVAAKHLSRKKGRLSLSGLTTLSDGAAKALAQHEGDLYLYGLTTLSDDAAKSLSQHFGRLDVGELLRSESLSPDAREALKRKLNERR
jgi:hypothetical protein